MTRTVPSNEYRVTGSVVRRLARYPVLGTFLFLAACGGTPPPDWKLNAVSALERYETRWLEGDGAAAENTFVRARVEIARTGRPDLAARAELIRCATRAAALDFAPCSEYDRFAADATPADQAYARFLAGDWQGLEANRLPAHYAGLVGARDEAQRNRAARAIAQPLPRLIAAAVLFRAGQLDPETLALAVETASDQGWRRPLLAWLQVQLKRAEAAGDQEASARLKKRIELVYASAPGLDPAR